MLTNILSILKVLFRNGETVINIIQACIQEVKKNGHVQVELDQIDEKILSNEDPNTEED